MQLVGLLLLLFFVGCGEMTPVAGILIIARSRGSGGLLTHNNSRGTMMGTHPRRCKLGHWLECLHAEAGTQESRGGDGEGVSATRV